MFRIADELQADLKYSNNERINLEMALLDMVAVKTAPSISSIISRLDGAAPAAGHGRPSAGRDRSRQSAARTPAPHPPPRAAQPARPGPGEAQAGGGTRAGPRRRRRRQQRPAEAGADGASPPSPEKIYRQWEDFLNAIKDTKQYLHCVLKPSSVRLEGDTLYITYPGGADHAYYSRILEKDNLEFIKKEMSGLHGRSLKVSVGGGSPAVPGAPEREKSAPPACCGSERSGQRRADPGAGGGDAEEPGREGIRAGEPDGGKNKKRLSRPDNR